MGRACGANEGFCVCVCGSPCTKYVVVARRAVVLSQFRHSGLFRVRVLASVVSIYSYSSKIEGKNVMD